MIQLSVPSIREIARARMRGLLMCMSFCGGLAVAAFAPVGGYSDPLSAFFVGFAFGVPAGFVVYPAYRFLRFALGH